MPGDEKEFIDELVERGVHYLWYYIYRPVGPHPKPELSLTPEQVTKLRKFMVEARLKSPIAIVDAYWDHDGNALCPAAVGIGHHISPAGYVEPCPPLQLAGDNIGDGKDIYNIISNSSFLKEFRESVAAKTRGCVIMEHPEMLEAMLEKDGVVDSSGRGAFKQELSCMGCATSHHVPGCEIPEKSWAYRFAKKNWFFGFGAYG